MAIRSNRFFNNPAFAQAASNLADLFAPPSGSDAAGWAAANAKNAEAERLAKAWEAAQDPNYSRDSLDRLFIGAGHYAPTQGYYAVDTDATTKQRGQDVAAASALAVQNASNQGELAKLYATPVPVNPGQEVHVPKQHQENSGLGPVLYGSDKPQTFDQWKAQQAERLRGSGNLTDNDLVETIMGGQPPVKVAGPNGPIYATPGSAARQGLPAYVDEKTPGAIKMYRTADGREGRTVDGMSDMVTNEPIPATARVGTISDTSDTFGTSEMGKVRDNILTRRAGVASMVEQVGALDERLARSDSAQAVGIVGSASRILNDLATQTEATLNALGVQTPPELRDIQKYQNTFRAIGVQNAEIQSSLLDLAYATAQARESGRLTENDIDRALRTLGGNLQDPTAMRQVLRSAANRALTDYKSYERVMMEAYGGSLNLQPGSFADLPPLTQPNPAGTPNGNNPRTFQTPAGAVTIQRVD